MDQNVYKQILAMAFDDYKGRLDKSSYTILDELMAAYKLCLKLEEANANEL